MGNNGQQPLILIALALKHEFGFDRLKAVNLTFPARQKSNKNIKDLFAKQEISEDDENELTRGYRYAKDALKKSATRSAVLILSLSLIIF